MGNDFRRIYGRRGPNSRTSSGVNLMRGYFIVQFYDDVKPELYVINDENTNVINNEIKSTSPLAKAVMDNKVGSAFFIEDYLERDLGTETGVSIIKKELEYIDYNPVLDGKTQYNYYYIKSYLDYVEPRKIETKREYNSNGKKVYIDLEFVSHDKLNKLITSLVKELNNRIKYEFTEISEKHKNDALLKIAKLENMKDKNFYQEDLDYIRLDIEKYIFYEMSYYNTFDLYINNLMDDIKSDEKITNSSSIVRSLKKMLESDTIDENNEIYNKVYPKLEKINKNYLPKFDIKYADYDYKPFDGYSIKKKIELSDIVDYYLEKYDEICDGDISLTHRKQIKNEINYKCRKKYNSDLEYKKHLQQLFLCEAEIYQIYDKFSMKLLEDISLIQSPEYVRLLNRRANDILLSKCVEDVFKSAKSILKIANNYNNTVGYNSIKIGTLNEKNGSYYIEFDSIDKYIIFKYMTNCMNEHYELFKKAYNKFNGIITEDASSYSLTSDEIIQDDFNYSQYRERRRQKAEEWKKNHMINTSTSSVNVDDTATNDIDGEYRKNKDEIIQDDFHYSQYREWRKEKAEEWEKRFNSNTSTSNANNSYENDGTVTNELDEEDISIKTKTKQSEVIKDEYSNKNDEKKKVIFLVVMLSIVGLLLLLFVSRCSKKDESLIEVNNSTTTSTTTTVQNDTTTKNNKKDSNKEKTTTVKKESNKEKTTTKNNNLTNKTTVTTSSNTITTTTTKKGDKLVRFYDGDSNQYKDYWLNVGDEFTLPTNNYNKQKTSNIEYRVYKDPLRYNDYNTYYSYTVYKKNGWVDSNGKKYKNGEKIIITDSLLYFKANYDKEIECAHVPTPTKEGYKFLGWSFVSGHNPRLDFEFCGSANEIMMVYGNWEEI